MKLLVLKTIYKFLLSTLPASTYNSITNMFFAPFTIKPYSTYINFKLQNDQISVLQKYIKNYTDDLELYPIKIFPIDNPSYFLSINIYNCSSPLFRNNDKEVTRCEINTYVKDKNNNYGTLILDYCSNSLSLDPVDLFKIKQNVNFHYNNSLLNYYVSNEKIKFSMNFDYMKTDNYTQEISEDLIQFTDNIFYKNGICDKLYYDSSIIKPTIKIPLTYDNFSFEYKKNDVQFDKIHSIFYFKNDLHFICGMWHNLYNQLHK
jgi:hypothetical protein